ncbi:MAG: hypothetical protein FWF51_11740 [Chitinivibrionia bacterium]|jgi:hypothetical protein|nr:hypothetical protein [Chitinivibrionia bacterium]
MEKGRDWTKEEIAKGDELFQFMKSRVDLITNNKEGKEQAIKEIADRFKITKEDVLKQFVK